MRARARRLDHHRFQAAAFETQARFRGFGVAVAAQLIELDPAVRLQDQARAIDQFDGGETARARGDPRAAADVGSGRDFPVIGRDVAGDGRHARADGLAAQQRERNAQGGTRAQPTRFRDPVVPPDRAPVARSLQQALADADQGVPGLDQVLMIIGARVGRVGDAQAEQAGKAQRRHARAPGRHGKRQ